MDRRNALARGLMEERGLDALVPFGNSGVNRHNDVNPFGALTVVRDEGAECLHGIPSEPLIAA